MDSRAIRPREGARNHIHGGRGLDGGNEGVGMSQVSGCHSRGAGGAQLVSQAKATE